jgi:hypothetical protein
MEAMTKHRSSHPDRRAIAVRVSSPYLLLRGIFAALRQIFTYRSVRISPATSCLSGRLVDTGTIGQRSLEEKMRNSGGILWRLPFIRRPFYQRDVAIADRDRLALAGCGKRAQNQAALAMDGEKEPPDAVR